MRGPAVGRGAGAGVVVIGGGLGVVVGLGTLLAHYAVRHFAQREIDRIVATVHSGNLAGARTLAKGGFESCQVTYEGSGVAGEEPL